MWYVFVHIPSRGTFVVPIFTFSRASAPVGAGTTPGSGPYLASSYRCHRRRRRCRQPPPLARAATASSLPTSESRKILFVSVVILYITLKSLTAVSSYPKRSSSPQLFLGQLDFFFGYRPKYQKSSKIYIFCIRNSLYF